MEALVTPSVLKWARNRSGLSISEAAKKIKRPPEDIAKWEAGDKRPTIAQARRASEVYRRALALFYLPEPPTDFETLRDYRRLPRDENREFSPELLVIVRTATEHQSWAESFLQNEDIQELAFVGSTTLRDDPEQVAQEIRTTLDISIEAQYRCRTRYEALRLWVTRSEKQGIFVFKKGGVDLRECRGFILSNRIAPFIYLNSDDAIVGCLFTLVHELAHLWLDSSGISNIGTRGYYETPEASQVEVFCNRVAAEALLDRTHFEHSFQQLHASLDVEDKIVRISQKFNVSEEAVSRRLLEQGIITESKYEDLRAFYRDRWLKLRKSEKSKSKERGGGPSYYVKMASYNGRAFTQLVIGAYSGNQIPGREASSLLNVKLNNFPKLARTVGIEYAERR